MSTLNFNEFSPVSVREWRQKIIADLKGKEYEFLLITTPENIRTRPDYHPDNEIGILAGNTHRLPDSWKINRVFDCRNPEKANAEILQSFEEGIDSIELVNLKPENLNTVLNGVLLQHIQLLITDNDSASLWPKLEQFCVENKINLTNLSGTLGYHPLANLSNPKELDDEQVKTLISKLTKPTEFKLFHVAADFYTNNGGTLTQELAIALAIGHEYLLAQTEQGVSAAKAADNIHFTFATGTDYFMEIAKYRAFRVLWNTLVTEYEENAEIPQIPSMHARTNVWNYTLFDRHNNLLRSTTQALSAALGGCQTITVVPYDTLSDTKDKTAGRLAKNIQIILKEEAFIDKVTDPAAGSWYIESLTDDICRKAWEIFQTIEQKGGFIQASDKGLIREMVNEAKAAKKSDVANGKTTLVGVNKYLNPEEDRSKLSGNVAHLSEDAEMLEREVKS